MKGTSEKYGKAAVALHWISMFLILGLWSAGITMTRLDNGAMKSQMYVMHVITGDIVVLLTLGRAIWAFMDTRPASPEDMPVWNRILFNWNHYLLYGVLFALGASGIAMLAMSGMTPFNLDPQQIGDVAPRDGHGLFARLFLVLFVMHVAGVVRHQMTGSDTMGRMGVPWFSKKA